MPFEFLLGDDSGSEDGAGADPQHRPRGRPPLVNRQSQSLRSFLQERQVQEAAFMNLVSGHFDWLPDRSSRTVRVFISSTFSDMHLERNVLMQRVYPKLKELCFVKYGLSFQMVDMRWGIQEGASLDQMATEICMEEITNCQSASMGPYFLAILSQRYGTTKLPYTVEKAVLENLMKAMKEKGMGDALQLTCQWYQLDENQLEPVYVLQPVLSKDSADSDRKKAISAWQYAEAKLIYALQVCVESARQADEISEDRAMRFTASVTHQEVLNGVQRCSAERRQDALLFNRELTDASESVMTSRPQVARFIDLKDGQIDEKTLAVLNNLKTQKLSTLLPKENIMEYRIPINALIDLNCDESKNYVETLAKDIENQLVSLITRAVEKLDALDSDSLYSEVLQHSHQCLSYVRQFQGREDTISHVKTYIESDSKHPLILYGASGCGKTSVMARAATLARNWVSELARNDTVVIVRFLGTSPSSSSIRQTLRSICQQMVVVLGPTEVPEGIHGEDFREIVNHFYKLAEKLNQQSRRVLIFLDSVDQLDPSDGAHTLGWLRPNLPAGTKFVLSTLPDLFDILESARSLLGDMDSSECFVEVGELNPDLCCQIVRDMLTERGRCLTEPQWAVLRSAFSRCSLPIYMNLVFNQVVSWKSYTPVSADLLETSVRGAIELLLTRLERQHGELLVSHALAYITASRSGLSEGEIEDLLSLDEQVLGEVFAHHLPPFIRLPPLCWTRVRHEIGPYLVEREADEARVLTWYHRQFWEVTRSRYFASADLLKATHSRLADYFLGCWAGRPKPFKCPPNLAAKLAKQGTPPPSEADRQVPAQPYVLQRDTDGPVRFNLRKLSELPFHLINSGRIPELHDHVTFNMDFLESKLSATSHHLLLRDLQLFLDLEESARGIGSDYEDAVRLFNALRIAGPSLNHSPLCLSVDICGRLRQFAQSSPRIGKLLSDCRHREDSSRILPLNACFDSGSSFTHCIIQLPLSMGRLCENGFFYSVEMAENVVTWFDTDGNIVKTVTCDHFPALCASLHSVLPRSGSFLSLEYLQLSKVFRLFKGNLLSGVWRPVIPNVADVISSSYYGDHDNPFASSENHMILKSSQKQVDTDWFACLKPDPLKVAYFAAGKKCLPLLSGDNFVFYVGSATSSSSAEPGANPAPARARVLLLEDYTEISLDCAELESGAPLEYKALVQDTDIVLVTANKNEPESAVKFTINRYLVGKNSVQLDFRCQVESANDPASDFNIAMSLDRSTVAICFSCLKNSMGFLCKLPQCEFIPLAYHPVLQKSLLQLKNFEHDVTNSAELHLSHDNRFLLAKTKCHYMFNIWSAQDGSFLTAIPYSENFYCLGQMPGTDYFLIGSVPESVSGVSFSLTKVLKLSMLAAYDMNSQNERMTRQQLAEAVFHIDCKSGRFVAAHFDQETGGSALEWDLNSAKESQLLLHQPLEEASATSSETIPDDPHGPASDLSLKASADNKKKMLVSSLMQTLKDRIQHADLRHCNALLLQEPGSAQVCIKGAVDAKFYANGTSHQKICFDIPDFFNDFKAEDRVFKGAEISGVLRRRIAGKELEVLISNHTSLQSFPNNLCLPGRASEVFPHTAQLSGVLCQKSGEIQLLVKPQSSSEGPSDFDQEGAKEINGISLLCTLDVHGRKAKRCMVLPSFQLGRQFMKYCGRQVALEKLKQAAFNFSLIVSKMGVAISDTETALTRQDEIGIDVSRQLFSYSLDFVREKIAELGKCDEADYSADTECLQRELVAQLKNSLILNFPELMGVFAAVPALQQLSAEAIITSLFSISELGFLSLKYNIKLSADEPCTPVMVFERPLHPHHVVVLYLCESVSSYADALDRERMCWPGRLVVCDTADMRLVSVSSTFDVGAPYLLPDGVHCVTYRLKVFNIETGDLVRDLDPEDSVILIDMVATPDRRIVIGKRLEMLRDLQTMGEIAKASSEDGERNPQKDAFMAAQITWGSRVLQAYSTSDGTLVFDYRLEADPLALLVPSNDRLVLLLKDHPIQLYEILGLKEANVANGATHAELLPVMQTDNPNSALVAEILQCDYLKFVKSVLATGLACVAQDRPADPIEFLARWLLEFAATQQAAQPTK